MSRLIPVQGTVNVALQVLNADADRNRLRFNGVARAEHHVVSISRAVAEREHRTPRVNKSF